MSAKLQQIERTIPPLSQSRYETLACDLLYRLRYIEGVRNESEAALRGKAIHHVVSIYVTHLSATRQKEDHSFITRLSEIEGGDVQEVLETFRDSFRFDPDKVLATEFYIALDKEFRPAACGEQIEYEGTLDLVVLPSQTDCEVHDWKSFYQIIAADTFQSKLYPLLMFCLNPALERVTFVLDFVRYGDAHRDVTYTREDVPKLKQMVAAQRERQIKMHSLEPSKLQALPGRHCTYCPKLTDLSCPISNTNPYGQMSPAERVAFAIWLKNATKENTRVLRDFMVEGGPISYRDGNDVEYRSEYKKQERRSYPLGKSFVILNSYFEGHPGDRDLSDKLTVSGLSSPLKAQKRSGLKAAMEVVAQVNVVTKLNIGRPNEKPEREEDE